MECPKCKFQTPEGIKFCGECGTKLEKKCPQCNFINPPKFKFCGECGYDLRESQGTSEINHTEPQSYTPKHLADKILTSRSSIEGERKFVTVLFADVANYTSISEKLDPEEVHQIMDGCFKILMDEIHQYEGTINQFTGDGVMALFGAPVSHEDHAQRACRAAITIQSALDKYEEKMEARYDTRFKMRIGINSGLVVVGSIGDDLRMDYTAVGDTTNLAARMESAANPGTILLSENSQKLVKDFFELKAMGKIKVKGKKQLQKAFQLMGTGSVGTRIGASVAKGLTRFVGRKNSISTFMNAFDKIKAGSGQVIGIVGEAGVGKSRFLLEMKNLLSQSEFEFLEGRCLQYGSSMLYLPVLDILKSIFNIKDDDKEFLIKRKINDFLITLDDQFSSLNPLFQDILSLKVDDETFIKLEPKEKREKIFEAIRDLLIRMSQNRPLVIAVEDLHWIDKTSEEFFNYFIDWLTNSPILLILLYRPEYTHQWGSKSFYTKIGVDQLSLNSSGKLITAILEEGEVAPELSRLILSRSAGNPLFMEEFTHTLQENGSIEKKENQFTLKGNPEDIQVPDTIQGIIAARMDRLEENLKRTMQVASVIGRDFAFKILQTITGMRSELKSCLLNLQGLEFIYEKNLFPELEYIFKHALTQEVAYNSLLKKRRKELHEKIGMAIEELYPERLEEFYEMLAYHFFKSTNLDQAIHYSKLAAKKAEKNFSHWETYNFYKNAYDLFCKKENSEKNKKERIDTLVLAGTPLLWLGMPDESLWVIDKQIELAEELGDSNRVSMSYNDKANYYVHRGDSELAGQYAEKAFKEAEKSRNLDLMVPSSMAVALTYLTLGRSHKILSFVPKVVQLIEEHKRESDSFLSPFKPYPFLLLYCGAASGDMGLFRDGIKYFNKGIKHALESSDKFVLATLKVTYGYIISNKGEWKLAIKYLKEGIKYAHEINYSWWKGYGYCLMGHATIMLGDHDTGVECLSKGLEMHENSGVEMMLPASYLWAVRAYKKSGNFKLAKEYAEKSLNLSIKNNDKDTKGYCKVLLGYLSWKVNPDQKSQSLDLLEQGMKDIENFKKRPLLALGYLDKGELYQESKEPIKAIENLKIAETMFQEMGMDFWLDRTQNMLSELK